MNKKILQLALPSIVSNITVPLLGLVDVAIVGHLGAASYIGAIAVGGMLFNIIYWLFGFLRMGTSGMTSQALGRRDFLEVTRVLFRSVGVVICLIASAKMNSTFSRYSRVRNHSGMTGRDAAEQILHREGLYDVRIEHISGNLTDHYDPRTRTLRLSDATYNSTSVAALGVAAHECGHAVQHATGYVPLKLRSSLVPVANFGSSIAWPLIILGFFFNSSTTSSLFINLGILAFSLAVLFQIVTLPVEFDASHRALKILGNTGMLYEDEVRDTRKVLTAAALTYVAGAASAILQLLRILLLTGNRRND